MTNPQPPLTLYAESVMWWGNANPYRRDDGTLMRRRQREPVTPADLQTDGAGNLSSIAVVVLEPCFGRPETYMRQRFTKPKDFKTAGGKVMERDARCLRCPANDACNALMTERIHSDPLIHKTLTAWNAGTLGLAGYYRFVGAVPSALWREFKDAVAARGPFENANDAAREAIDKAATDRRRAKDAIAKKNRRAARRELGMPPSPAFVASVFAERDRRVDQLDARVADRTGPRFVTKLKAHGVGLTADVWAASTILSEHGTKITAGKLADWLAGEGRDHAMARETLRVRVLDDLRRALLLEQAGIWETFEPDA